MFQSINFRSNKLFSPDVAVREAAVDTAWNSFTTTKDQILTPTWEDRVVDAKKFSEDTRIFWDEEFQRGALSLPNRAPVVFTRETPFLAQLLAHYQIDKRMIDRLLDTRNPKHREVMEFIISSLMIEPFREVKDGQGRMVRIIDEGKGENMAEAMAFLSSNYLRLDHGPYLDSLERWGRDNRLVPIRTWAKGGDVGVDLVESKDIHPNGLSRGELIAFGISTKNSMTGGASFAVESHGMILACTNGMTTTEFLGRYTRRHIGRRLGASEDALEITNREEQDVATILNRAKGQVSDAMNPELHAQVQDAIRETTQMNLEDRLDGFRRARAAFMDNQKAQTRTAQELQHHLGLSMGESVQVLNNWFAQPAGIAPEEPSETIPNAWGLVQATTRLGRDLSDAKPDRTSELATIGGSLLKQFRDNRREFDKIARDVIHAATK